MTAALAGSLLFIAPCLAQQGAVNSRGVMGNFYVSVDDGAKIFVNGQKIHEAGMNESRSGELELKADQRIVVQLRDDGGGHRFMLVFVSSDKKTVVSFRQRDFKIVPDIGVTDFTPEEFQKWTKFAKDEQRKSILPVKSNSDWVWGDMSKCILACMIRPDMLKGAGGPAGVAPPVKAGGAGAVAGLSAAQIEQRLIGTRWTCPIAKDGPEDRRYIVFKDGYLERPWAVGDQPRYFKWKVHADGAVELHLGRDQSKVWMLHLDANGREGSLEDAGGVKQRMKQLPD